MQSLKMRAVLSGAKVYLPALVALVCLLIVATAAVDWGVAVGIRPGSFLLGFAGGAMTACLMLRAAPRDAGNAEWVNRRTSLECQRVEADTEYCRWAAKRERLECRRLRRDLRNTDWMGGGA